jgi:hypothetical protein
MIAGSSKLTDSWVLPHLLALFLVELLGPIRIPETSIWLAALAEP